MCEDTKATPLTVDARLSVLCFDAFEQANNLNHVRKALHAIREMLRANPAGTSSLLAIVISRVEDIEDALEESASTYGLNQKRGK